MRTVQFPPSTLYSRSRRTNQSKFSTFFASSNLGVVEENASDEDTEAGTRSRVLPVLYVLVALLPELGKMHSLFDSLPIK
jgi:hypothetical protein